MFPVEQPHIELPGGQVHPAVGFHHLQLLTGEQLPIVGTVDDTAEHILKVGDIVRNIFGIPSFARSEWVMLRQGGRSGGKEIWRIFHLFGRR